MPHRRDPLIEATSVFGQAGPPQYLLRGLKIERANQVWATDITYIPMACGWVYLCAIVDWASRKVLSARYQ